ncbi:ABC transporter substrate-binding protein [Natronosporangium hydrolyticum]|uniref:ABC transporter substrate-binding protein n=1 Tax=Natronosporangium hydrolyticum TaxID=2811111 RepID=A0A895Y580_9ACTN|nr:ABC transporter substrate-binding protein [Natronosporangium hydrolyticum]QSB12847.1 ABC transporter substrate-binding protein [Natronosporangium hydrolyticum]
MLPPQRRLPRRTVLAAGMAAAAAAPAGALLSACGSGQTSVTRTIRDEITYLDGVGPFGREAYVHLTVERGYFADEGLVVNVEPGGAGANAATLLAGGRVQFAAVDAAGVIIRHGLGEDTDTVIVSAVQQQTTAAILSLTADRPRDLEGATIGGLEGSVIETLFPTYAELSDVRHGACDHPRYRFAGARPGSALQRGDHAWAGGGDHRAGGGC